MEFDEIFIDGASAIENEPYFSESENIIDSDINEIPITDISDDVAYNSENDIAIDSVEDDSIGLDTNEYNAIMQINEKLDEQYLLQKTFYEYSYFVLFMIFCAIVVYLFFSKLEV